MDVVALADGDLEWVFGDGAVTEDVSSLTAQAARTMARVAADIKGYAGWEGNGLEFCLTPGAEGTDPKVTLVGSAASAESAEFYAELSPAPEGWVVEAWIAVRCDGVTDCSMHDVEEWPSRSSIDALEAATQLLGATKWLGARAAAELPGYWRDHDPIRGHA